MCVPLISHTIRGATNSILNILYGFFVHVRTDCGVVYDDHVARSRLENLRISIQPEITENGMYGVVCKKK